ncbi:hypothetical protein CPB83DRAFT_865510 [Crepidotus variabilis]|uniref:Uncharacterized protein n=1 Tax=Crepidotus variabilis TaxID=179855 RepID=A0A9P6BBN4_9AGAR|nr:hypothetical protein CPB83DRAFT_865510 [Crepidotus variabilis]
MAAVYPSAIPSLKDKHPNLPNRINQLELNRPIQAGQILNRQNVVAAKAVASGLRSLHDLHLHPAIIDDDIVQSAEERALAVQNVHAGVEYTPANLFDMLALLNNNVTALRAEVAASRAESANSIIKIRNRFMAHGVLSPTRKAVQGSGLPLARARVAGLDPPVVAALEVYGANVAPNIGDTPPFFNGSIDHLLHIDILKLICFYNEDLGINPGDNLAQRKGAVRVFLGL